MQTYCGRFKGALPSGDYLQVAIYEYSRFFDIEITKSNSIECAIPKLDKVIMSLVTPLKAKIDNGFTFDCGDFDKYAKYLGFIHHPSAPTYPQINGLAENINKLIGKVLRKANK